MDHLDHATSISESPSGFGFSEMENNIRIKAVKPGEDINEND